MPCDYKKYPKNWKAIREEILERAKNQCEWVEPSGDPRYDVRCIEKNGANALWFKGRVVLTIAHTCHKTKCARRAHLRAWCQLHHLRYDAKHHAFNAALTRDRKKGQQRFDFQESK